MTDTAARSNVEVNSSSVTIKIVGHSQLIYWWPIWILAIALGAVASAAGNQALFEQIIGSGANWYTLMNLVFLLILFFVVAFTNMRAEGAPAINIALSFALVVLLIYVFGGKLIPKEMPGFLVFMNSNFYFTFGIGIFAIWVFSVAVYDRRKIWIVGPRRFTEVRFPLRKVALDTNDMRLIVNCDDIICHNILGFGLMGDITVTSKDRESIIIPNVFNARRKADEALRLVATHYSRN